MNVRRTIRIIIILFTSVQVLHGVSKAVVKEDSSLIVEYEGNQLSIEATKTPLGMLLNQIRDECSLQISGLSERENELVTLSFKGEVTAGIKQLLKVLGEKNYAFEFTNESLRHVKIYPESKNQSLSVKDYIDTEPIQQTPSTAVRIEDVLDGSQAQTLGLLRGDLIIEYDGVKIRTNRQLIGETLKKAHKTEIGMMVVRDNILMPFVVKGGKIGVRIRTIRIPQNELDYYDSGP